MFNYFPKKTSDNEMLQKSRMLMGLLYLSLFLEVILMGLMFILPSKWLRLVACSLCVVILCMILLGYKLESYHFSDSDELLKLRKFGFGTSINPKHPLGRFIYLFSMAILIFLFFLILIFG